MAINKDDSLALRHVCYVAASGNGKGIAIKHLGEIPKQPNLLIFDPYKEYEWEKGNVFSGIAGRPVYHFYDRKSFLDAAKKARMSNKPFRVAYSPKTGCDRKELLWFCELVWAMSDGKRRLDVIFGELARMVETAGKENSRLGEIYTGGRKFNIVAHADFQRSSEIPKTVWGNSPVKVIGGQEAMLDANRMQKELDCSIGEIIDLGKQNAKFKDNKGRFSVLHYLHKTQGIGNYAPVAIDLRAKPPVVRRG